MTIVQAAYVAASAASHAASAVSQVASPVVAVASQAIRAAASSASVAATTATSVPLTTNELWTLGIAVYGAFVATVVLGWDAYKYLATGPKVEITAQTGMVRMGLRPPDPNKYISITAVNKGDRPTTITNLGFLYYDTWFKARFRRNRASFAAVVTEPSQAQRIPYRFDVGDQWIGLCEQDAEVEKMIREGYFFMVLYHSHGGKGVRYRLAFSKRELPEQQPPMPR